jgi:hypothetical protein
MQIRINPETEEQVKIKDSSAYTVEQLQESFKAPTYEALNKATGIAPATAFKCKKEKREIYHNPTTGKFFTVQIKDIGEE